MRAMRVVVFFTLVILLAAGSSFAQPTTVSLKFDDVGPGNQIGGEYAYPYNFYIAGSHTLTPLICDTYGNSISFGQSWNANVASLVNGTGYFGNQGGEMKNYEAAAILFYEIAQSGTVGAGIGNLAIWDLFEPSQASTNAAWNTIYSGSTTVGQEVANLIAAADMMTAAQTKAFYNQFFVYTPVAGFPNDGHSPQEFLGFNSNGTPLAPGALPEPASLALLGSGILSLGVTLRGRLNRRRVL